MSSAFADASAPSGGPPPVGRPARFDQHLCSTSSEPGPGAAATVGVFPGRLEVLVSVVPLAEVDARPR